MPVAGNAADLFQDLGPDYFGRLLEEVPTPDSLP